MALLQKIQADLKAAMVSRDANKLGVLRLLLSQIHNFEIDKKAKSGESEILDSDVEGVIRKEYKKRKEATQMFKDGGRTDLVEKEEKELLVFGDYLPKELSESEIAAAVDEAMASGKNDFGLVMKEVMSKLGGQADGKLVSELVRKKIGK